MRVDQLVGSVVEGDAISWDAVAIREALLDLGFESDIYVKETGSRPRRDVTTRPAAELTPGADLLIYHLSIGSELTERYFSYTGPRIVRYHNVTPARYFEGWDPPMVDVMKKGRLELRQVAGVSDLGLGVSEYNRTELEAAGFPRTDSLPIVPDHHELEKESDPRMAAELAARLERGPLWLFVGRFVPNKSQVDLVRAFAAYRRGSSRDATLLLIGSAFTASYRDATLALATDLGVADSVMIPGQVSDEELAACYRAASVFVCLSEHEGFCLPLIEAMRHHVPIVAYAAAAVPETVAGAGILLDDKDPVLVAATVDELLGDVKLQTHLNDLASARLQGLTPDLLKPRLQSIISEVLS